MKYEDIRRQVLTAIRQASAQGLILSLIHISEPTRP